MTILGAFPVRLPREIAATLSEAACDTPWAPADCRSPMSHCEPRHTDEAQPPSIWRSFGTGMWNEKRNRLLDGLNGGRRCGVCRDHAGLCGTCRSRIVEPTDQAGVDRCGHVYRARDCRGLSRQAAEQGRM